jgi:hypothetical protein
MFDRFQYPYTFGGPEFVMPLLMVVSVFIVLMVLRNNKSYWFKFSSVLASWVVIGFLIYGEVYSVGKKWDKLCEERMGLHVYETVEAEGFIGVTNIDKWSTLGFKYVEKEFIGQRKFRYSMLDGGIVKEDANEFISQYELGNSTHIKIDESIFENITAISRVSTGEVLGELIIIGKYPVGIDRIIFGLFGSNTPNYCRPKDPNTDTEIDYDSLVYSVIKPKK